MNITLYSGFSKRINSTRQPGGGESRSVVLKENTSIEHPTFILSGSLPNYNYAEFDGRYYYVDDIVSIAHDLYELSCSIDYLATYKSEIGSYNCFVERSSSNYDTYLIDSAVSMSQAIEPTSVSLTTAYASNYTDSTDSYAGAYIVRVVGSDSSEGGIATYAMDEAQLGTLLNYCFDENNFTDEIVDQFVKTFFNPFQYIVSVMWFPVKLSSISGTSSALKLGWWSVPSHLFKKLSTNGFRANVPLTNPTNLYTDFRAYHPNFTQLSLTIPGSGCINIDPTLLSSGVFSCETLVDYITGEATTEVIASGQSDRNVIATIAGRWGVPVTIGQLQSIAGGIAETGTSVLSGILGANPMSVMSGAIEGIKNIFSPTPSIVGGTGNKSDLINRGYYALSLHNYGSGELATGVYGRPCCKNLTLSSIPGYIKCANASVPIPSLGKDRDIVNSYLNNGFYYE